MELKEIIQKLKKGDRGAAKNLYLHSYKWLYAVTLQYVADEATGQDILQNTYEKIFKNIPLVDAVSDAMIAAWMRKICINEALAYLRKKKNWNKLQVNPKSEAYLPNYEFETKALYQLLYQLPEQQRICFNLFALKEYSHKEIAEQLNIKESYSRTLVARARKRLAKLLPKEMIHEAS